jgi:streptogramin lyase
VSSQTSSTITVSALTDPQGEAAFRLRVGASEENITVEVSAAALPEVEPVRFLTIVGLQALSAIATDPDGNLIVADERLRGVIRVDPRSGDRTIVSDATTGRGLPFAAPVGLAVEADGHLVVVDFGLAAVIRVDPRSGDRTVVSDGTTGRGPRFIIPAALAVEADGHLVVVDSVVDAVIRVDSRTGDRTIASAGSTGIGSGPPLKVPVGITVEATGHLLVVDSASKAVESDQATRDAPWSLINYRSARRSLLRRPLP